MHLASSELNILPSAVATIAIVSGYLGVGSAKRGQLRLAQESY